VTAKTLLPLVALVVAVSPGMAQQPSDRRCSLEVLNVDREGSRDERLQGNVNYFAAGNVRLRCIGQPIFLDGDSLESYNAQVIRLITAARYRDDDITLDADTLTYLKGSEMLQARGNVRIVNRASGSTLEGPYVDYLRAVRALGRDSSETTAIGRPTVQYRVPRAVGDSVDPSPYVIVADGLRARGSAHLIGWGRVTVDREALSGQGDSLVYESGADDLAVLIGEPASMVRAGEDSFRVTGRRVELGLRGEALRIVRAFGGGHVVGSTGEIIADSTALEFAEGELVQTLAWDRADGAHVLASGYDVRGDSVAIDTPGERLRELRVFDRGILVEPEPDSAAVAGVDSAAVPADSAGVDDIRNTMTGTRITARFVDHDSAGTLQTRLMDIVAIGNATSLFAREVARDGRVSPTVNYTRADTIVVTMKSGDSTGVAEVRAFGNVDGLQLERESLERTAVRGAVRREEQP
jgi:hypothetical protein